MYALSNYDNLNLKVNEVGDVEIKVYKEGKWVEPQILYNFSKESGYKYKCIKVKDVYGKLNRLYLHKLIATNLIDNPNDYKEVTFKDGNRLNCNVNNLEWVDRKIIHKKTVKRLKDKTINEYINEIENFTLTKLLKNNGINSLWFYSELITSILILCGIIYLTFFK